MNFEQLQNQWQQQTEGESIMIQTEFLLKEVRRNKQYFDAMIFWRDVREAGLAFVLLIFFVVTAIKDKDMILIYPAAACLFVGSFMVVDRIRLKKKHPYNEKYSSLAECIRTSLIHINHQIWLLKNVAWWYLLPFVIGVSIPFFIGAWSLRSSDLLIPFLFKTFGFLIVVYIGIYYLNQFAVSKALKPRKEELEELLKSIENHSQGKEAD